MGSEFDEIHDELRAVARDLLVPTRPRAGSGSSPGPADWSQMAQAGWLGLEVAEALGGAGATFAEVAVILEELGRAATASPYLGTVVLAAGALALVDVSDGADELRRAVAAGELAVAVVLGDGAADAVPAEVAFRLERTTGGLRLHGLARYVADAAGAEVVLLVALDPAGEPVLVRTGPDAAGLLVEPEELVDETHAVASVSADGVVIGEDDVWGFAGDGATAVAHLADRAAVALALDALGLSRAMLDETVAYAAVREQFGRPIGSFQAVKHACADMLVQVTVAEELVGQAVAALVAGDPEASTAASMAKAYATAAGVEVAGAAMQLHGGIGYTWESGVHVYLKRAVFDRAAFGSPRAHRHRIARRYPSPVPGG